MIQKQTQAKTITYELAKTFRDAFGFYEDGQKTIYSSKPRTFKENGYTFTSTNDVLKELQKFGVSEDLSVKEAQFVLEKWYNDLLKQQGSKETPAPEYVSNTTLTPDQIVNFDKDVERIEESEKIRAGQKQVTESFEKRNKEIYDQQRTIQEQIKKAQELGPKFTDKKVYATVERQAIVANLETQKSFETLTEYASYAETRTDLINQLTESIQPLTGTDAIITRTIAVQLVNDIANPELAHEKVREIAIEEAIEQNKGGILEKVLQKENTLIETAKKGAILEAEVMKNSVFLTREIAESILPLEIVEQIYGPKQIKVILSSEKSGQTTHEVDLEKSVKNYEINLKEQNKFLDSVREGGVDGAKSVFRSQLYSNVNIYLAKAPKGSALGKVYSSDAVKAILTQGSPNALELKYFGKNPLLQTYFKYSPESMPYFKLFTEVTGVSVGVGVATKIIPLTYGGGGIPLAKIAYIQQVKSLGIPYTLGTKVGGKFAVGLGARTAGQAAGKAVTAVATKTGVTATLSATLTAAGASVPVPVLNVILAAAGWVAGELVSKLKTWWTKNKDKAGPAIAIGLGFGGLMLGGPGAGAVGLGVGLAATGSLAAFAAGAFGVLGFIGRSIGIAIATPVIITLLVIPPLVAFIMLVINNSAYVVPPGLSSSALNGGADNPYMLVTKIASPNKIDNPTSPQQVIYGISIKAIKESLFNVRITAVKCTVLKKDGKKMECPDEDVPPLEEGKSISPTQVHAFSFISRYDVRFNDSLVMDSIEVTAELADGTVITTSGSASLCVGECPHGCFKISNDNEAWPQNYSSTISTAVAELTSKFPQFVDKACVGRPSVKLCYTTKDPSPIGTKGLCDNAIYAITSELSDSNDGCVINFNQCGVRGSSTDAFFLLTHEISHHISWRDGGEMINSYLNKGAQHELPLCSYSGTQGDPDEGSAEANALYANGGTASFSTCSMNFQSQYPKNYSYAQEYMNKP